MVTYLSTLEEAILETTTVLSSWGFQSPIIFYWWKNISWQLKFLKRLVRNATILFLTWDDGNFYFYFFLGIMKARKTWTYCEKKHMQRLDRWVLDWWVCVVKWDLWSLLSLHMSILDYNKENTCIKLKVLLEVQPLAPLLQCSKLITP